MGNASTIALAASCLLASGGPAAAAAESELAPGAYRVAVHLEMAQTVDASNTVTLCITDAAKSRSRGLAILTPHTPISACPVSNVRQDAGTIAFDIVCEGPNAGHAEARFETAEDSFKGRITMLMGGKNMRMTEVQEGRRTGECGEAR